MSQQRHAVLKLPWILPASDTHWYLKQRSAPENRMMDYNYISDQCSAWWPAEGVLRSERVRQMMLKDFYSQRCVRLFRSTQSLNPFDTLAVILLCVCLTKVRSLPSFLWHHARVTERKVALGLKEYSRVFQHVSASVTHVWPKTKKCRDVFLCWEKGWKKKKKTLFTSN